MRIPITVRVLLGALACSPTHLFSQSNYQLVLDVPATTSPYVFNAIQNPSGSQWILGSTSSSSSAIHKFDPDGNAVWSKEYSSPPLFSGITDMISDGSEGAYCLRRGPAPDYDEDTMVYTFQLAHLSASGAVDWARDITVMDRFQNTSMLMHDVLHRFSDGSLGLLVDFFTPSDYDRWNLSKYSASGELLWSELIGSEMISGIPMLQTMQSDPPTVQDDGTGGMFVIGAGGSDPLETTLIAHVSTEGSVDWLNEFEYSGPHQFSNCLAGGLLSDGSLATIGYLVNASSPLQNYCLIHRIGSDGALIRSDLVSGTPFEQAYVKPGSDNNMVIMVGLGVEGGPHLMVISPTGEVLLSNKRRRLTIGSDYVFIGNVGMGLSENTLTLGGDLRYQDIIFSTMEYKPTLERLDVFGTADDCMWQPLPVEHLEVPDNLVSTNAITPIVEDVTSLNSSTSGTWTVETISNINTIPLCSIEVGMMEGMSENSPFVLNSVVARGEEVLLDRIDAGEVRVVDNQGRMIIALRTGSNTRFALRTKELSAGGYQVVWTSSQGDQVKRGRFVVE